MGGQIDDIFKDLVSANKTIGAAAVLDPSGRVVYTTQNWKINGNELIASWRNKAPAVSVQNVKYSTLQATEERLIATNVSGKGHIVMSTVGEKGVLIAYVTAQGDPQVGYADVARAAAMIHKAI
jgi:predicted regulator of Ras-like GTPase activity (Roadblock/LC7/MglB family)